MRLARLDLLRYGAFEGRSLTLRPDARLHVVFGANEAGKSTTLAALGDLLFGFPSRTTQDFRFRQTDLRIGGALTTRGGAIIDFVRRKGAKNTLLTPDGKPLADDALAPYLGQMTREVFSGAFGLDAECLRKGAEELLQARGEVGSSLMAAASGLRGLTALRKQLEDEAEGVFAPNKSNARRFYQARDRFDLAKKAVTDSELRASAWKKINDAIAESRAEGERLGASLRKLRGERTRVARLKALAPLIRRIDAQHGSIAADADLPEPPAGFVAELEATILADKEAGVAVARATAELEDSARALAGIAIDAALLDRAMDIEALVARVGEHQKDSAQLPRVSAAHDGAQADLDRHARLLGLADAQALVSVQPTAAALARVRELAEQGQAIAQEKANIAESLRSEAEFLALVEAERAAQRHVVDPGPLQEMLAALGNPPALVRARDDKRQALHREEEALRREAAGLTPAVDDLSRLAMLALPDAEAIGRFVERFQSAASSEREAALRARDAASEAEATRQRMEDLAAGGEVPTPERIAAARATRDAAWTSLRAALFGEPGAPADAALAESVARFEVATADADALADAAARDASRVAEYASLSASLDRQTKRRDEIVAERQSLQAAREALETGWLALWSGAGVAPLDPAKMQNWRTAVGSLLDRHARLADARYELGRAEAELDALAAPLASIAAAAGLPAMDIDAALQSARIATRLRELSRMWEEARGVERRRDDIKARIGKLERDLDRRTREHEDWTGRWRVALPSIGLPVDAGVAEATSAIEAWRLAPQLIDKRDDLARRVAGLRRDIARFEGDARSVLDVVATDLASLPAADAITQVSRRLDHARREEARRDELAKRRDACDDAVGAALRTAGSARAALERLAAHAPAGADLAETLHRLKRRQQASDALVELRHQLAEQSGGHDESAIRAEVAAFDADHAEAELASLAQDEERLTQESQEAYATLKAAERQVSEFESGYGSEIAWQNRMNAQAEMQEAARQWLVLRLASAMLSDALERHRAGRQDPLMQRASAIFAAVTGGAYAEITQSFDDNDRAVLQGLRASGERVAVEGMSEGTRDQLYLALRLAYVEDYAARAEPAPFVADDLFTSFDDARTARALAALADTGAHTQCILFTHHRHVADLAAAALGAAADVVEL